MDSITDTIPVMRNIKRYRYSNGGDTMDIKSLAKGAAAGAAVGLAVFALTEASPSKKMSIKRDANKILKAANSLWDDIRSLMM